MNTLVSSANNIRFNRLEANKKTKTKNFHRWDFFLLFVCLFVCFSPQQDRRLRDTTRTGRRPSVFDEPASLSNTGRFKKALKESKLGCKLLQKMEPLGLEIAKSFSEPTSSEAKEAKSLEIGVGLYWWVICTMASFTTTTRIPHGFPFLCKLRLLSFKSRWDYQI